MDFLYDLLPGTAHHDTRPAWMHQFGPPRTTAAWTREEFDAAADTASRNLTPEQLQQLLCIEQVRQLRHGGSYAELERACGNPDLPTRRAMQRGRAQNARV